MDTYVAIGAETPKLSIKSLFDSVARDGKRFALVLDNKKAIGGADVNELVQGYKAAQRAALSSYVNRKPAMVFDTTRDFNAQYEWQRQHGVGYNLISPRLKDACNTVVQHQTREVSRQRRRRRKRLYGW